MDPTNPFAGGLPPPPSSEEDLHNVAPTNLADIASPVSDENLSPAPNPYQLDRSNPFLTGQPAYSQQQQQYAAMQMQMQRAAMMQQYAAQQYARQQYMAQQQQQQQQQQQAPTNPFLEQQAEPPPQQQQQASNQAAVAASQHPPQPPPQSDNTEAKTDEKEQKQLSPEQEKEAKRARNRVRAVNELISTERTYVIQLLTLNKQYINPMKDEKYLKAKFHGILFPVILQTILELNKKLLKALQANPDRIGKAMIDFIPYLKMYQMYMNNHEAATRLIKQLRADKNSEFTKYLLQKELEQKGFTMESFLILPIQRMPRYELCLKEIIKLTPDDHEDKENLVKCLEKVAAVNKQINFRMQDYTTRQKVHEIEMRIINLEVNKEKNKNKEARKSGLFKRRRNSKSNNSELANEQIQRTRLVTPSRIFIKQGYLTKISRKKHIKYVFVLFNDLLIYCSETGMNDRLILHQKLDLTDEFFRIESAVVLDDDIDYTNSAGLYMIQNSVFVSHVQTSNALLYIHRHTDPKKKSSEIDARNNTFEIHSIQKSFLCYAENNTEREEWISAIEKCLDTIKKSVIPNKQRFSNANANDNNTTSRNLNVESEPAFGRFASVPLKRSGSLKRIMSAQPQARKATVSGNATPTQGPVDVDAGRILETAPIWIPNDWTNQCMMPLCNNTFNALRLKKRNHCRYCGKLVCSDCCSQTLPHYEPNKRKSGVYVKVCDLCYEKYKVKPLINVEQLSILSQEMAKNSNSQLQSLKQGDEDSKDNENGNDNANANEVKEIEDIDDEGSSSSEWNGLYDQQAYQQSAQQTPVGDFSSPVTIPQSFTPITGMDPSTDGDVFNLLETGTNTAGMQQYAQSWNNNNYGGSMMMFPPMAQSQTYNSSANIANVFNTNNHAASSPASMHSNQSSKDVFSSSLPNPMAMNQKDKKLYDEDLGTVSAIIAANDNLINSMDLSGFYGKDERGIDIKRQQTVNAENNVNSLFDDDDDSKDNHKDQYANAVVLDDNVEAHDSDDSDEFASNFANIVIPDAHKSPVARQTTEEFYSFMGGAEAQKKPEEPHGGDEEDAAMYLDVNHENVKQLTLFGFNVQNIEDAWKLMKQHQEHRSIVPDHGPLFTETMLDYLNKVQKERSKSVIMSQYNKKTNNNNNVYSQMNQNQNNFANFDFV